jgi:hypothetical protein
MGFASKIYIAYVSLDFSYALVVNRFWEHFMYNGTLAQDTKEINCLSC